jgi:hypothetical protein
MRFAIVVLAMVLMAIALAARASVVKPDEAALKAAPAAFPFADWDALLARYVDDQGRVDYGALKANAADLATLERLVAAVAATGPKTHPEKFTTSAAREAYFLDAYNILVWKNVLDRLGPKFTNVDKEKLSFFYSTRFIVDGSPINLLDLEKKIIRPSFQDGRVHMALNCASGGCPILPKHAFSPGRVDEQLSDEARRFCNEKRNVDFDPATRTLKLSRIFDWYKEDFGKKPASVIDWINHYRAPDAKIPTDAKIQYVDYDWTLNDVHILKR